MKQLFLILFVVAFVSCGAQRKNLSLQEKKDLHLDYGTDTRLDASLFSICLDNSDITEEIVREVMSEPDSAGRQYVKERNTVRRNIAVATRAEVGTEARVAVKVDSTVSEVTSIDAEDIEERQMPGWVIALAVTGVLCIIGTVMLILVKLRIL